MRPARKTLRRPDELVAAGLIPGERRGEIEAVAARYALALTADVAELIDPADPRDPMARQFVPAAAELDARPEEMADPIGDGAHSPLEGIVHRYPDRVLLKPVHVCAAYCRFCFRREVVGRAGALSRAQLDAVMAYIRSHREIWEVILTGGDPLVHSPRRLGQVVETLAAIDHGHAGVHADDLDVVDRRQRFDDLPKTPRREHERIAAGEDHLPDLALSLIHI